METRWREKGERGKKKEGEANSHREGKTKNQKYPEGDKTEKYRNRLKDTKSHTCTKTQGDRRMKRAIVRGGEIQKETEAQRERVRDAHALETAKAEARRRRGGGGEKRESEGDRPRERAAETGARTPLLPPPPHPAFLHHLLTRLTCQPQERRGVPGPALQPRSALHPGAPDAERVEASSALSGAASP